MMGSDAARFTATIKPFFKCPNCNALYHIVKVEVGPESADREITCRSCGASLQAREGKFTFKYFLLRKSGRRQKRKKTRASNDRASHRTDEGLVG
jgi:predicted Zn finger-like uncharacterized protein